MSRDRASTISNINSKYAGTAKTSSLYYQLPVQHVEVVPPVYLPGERTEAVRAVKYFDRNDQSTSGIPKYVWFLVGILLLAAVVGAIYYFWSHSKKDHASTHIIQPIEGRPIYTKNG